LTNFPKGGAAGAWSPKCDASLSSDFTTRDAIKDYVPCDTDALKQNAHFGPNVSKYPKIDAALLEGCDLIKWQQQRILKVISNIISKGYNYCHHHAPSWVPPVDPVKYRVALNICPEKGGSGDPTESHGYCSLGRMNGTEPVWNGMDCTTYTSYMYNYGLGMFLVTNVGMQGCGPNGPGRIMGLTVGDTDKFQIGDLIYLYKGDGGKSKYAISHVIVWTGIIMTFDDGPFSYNKIKLNVPECQWKSQDKYIQSQKAAGKAVYIISDSHWNGPNYRPFAGWYINNFGHVRRVIGIDKKIKDVSSKYCVKGLLKN